VNITAEIIATGPDKLQNLVTTDVTRQVYHAITGGIEARFQIFDPEYRILWNNFPLKGMSQRGLGEWPGKICYHYYFGLRRPCATCPVQKVLALGRAAAVEKRLDLPDGSVEWVEIRGYPVRDNQGNITRVLTIGYDITDRKQHSENQKHRLKALETTLDELTQSRELLESVARAGLSRFNLTGRELEVLCLMAEGLTNNQISETLRISSHTVKSHVIHIFDKLGVNDRTKAAVWAARLGLI
jgi:DNA-binding CsgD family transcriptional regulator